jgi:antitoxin (DNA-binding transcriptional repressor) of toxin-antitoxin stability system
MTTINAKDLATSLDMLLTLARRGETILLVENGIPLARLEPANAASVADDEEEEFPWWRDGYAPSLPVQPLPTVAGGGPPVTLEKRPMDPAFFWLPDDDDVE